MATLTHVQRFWRPSARAAQRRGVAMATWGLALLLGSSCWTTSSAHAQAGCPLVLKQQGVTAQCSGGAAVSLPMPNLLVRAGGNHVEKPTVALEQAVLVARYASGATVRAEQTAPGVITFSFATLPHAAQSLMFFVKVPAVSRLGGGYALDGQAPQPFPEQAGAQLLMQGQAKSFTLYPAQGPALRVGLPADFSQVQDARTFGGSGFLFVHHFSFKAHPRVSSFTVHFETLPLLSAHVQPAAKTPAGPRHFVDRYGQVAKLRFAGKVKADAELQADARGEESRLRLSKLNRAQQLDTFGGLAGSRQALGLSRTGYFHVEEAGSRQLLVTPEGNAFFQLAACGVSVDDSYTLVTGREELYEWLPPRSGAFARAWRPGNTGAVSFYIANLIRKYGAFDLDAWTGQVVRRARAWGLNSAGAFSVHTESMQRLHFPRVSAVQVGARVPGLKLLPKSVGFEVLDPFASDNEQALESAFAKLLPPAAEDPLLIGYYLGNEQHYELLPKRLPLLKASEAAAKAKLVELLQAQYGAIARFNAAWQPTRAFASFSELAEAALEVRTEAAAADMRNFHRLFFDAFYGMVARVFRKYDAHHLLIGSRLAGSSAVDRDLIEVSGRHLDVLSINYYSYQIEHEFLSSLHEASGGRPIILSEWYFGAGEQGLSGGKEVGNQRDRALAYRNYVEQAAALPFVVGTEWFGFNDQPVTGRYYGGFEGEAHNTGLVNVADRPYPELTQAMRQTGARIYDVLLHKLPPYVFADSRFTGVGGGVAKVVTIPKAVAKNLALDGSTRGWPGFPSEGIDASRLAVGSPDPSLRGDFRLCWDAENLYFLIHVVDRSPARNRLRKDALWSGDAIELFLGSRELDRKGQLSLSDRQIIVGVGAQLHVQSRGHEEETAAYRVHVSEDVSGSGYVIEASLPWSVLQIAPAAGSELLFDVAIDNSEDGITRRQQLVWNGNGRNSSDRGAWGRARLVQN
jgi:hypothetical protein